MTEPEPIPIRPKPEPGWEAAERSRLGRQEQVICWWHGKPCPTAKVREPQGQPICWDGWVALLHATGTCAGQCCYETEPGTERTMRPCLRDL